MSKRDFRSPESLKAERTTRNMMHSFLTEKGFNVIDNVIKNQGQTITAITPRGDSVCMGVRLCWRRETNTRDSERVRTYSAAQLIAKIQDDDWEGSIRNKIERDRSKGLTHLLLVQRDDKTIPYAALIPLDAILPIWEKQARVSDSLIREGKLGKRKKNHARNGHSPTIWLQDDRGGQDVADALWSYPGVINIADVSFAAEEICIPEEVSKSLILIEGACKKILVNAYERDAKARLLCIKHYGAVCFICKVEFSAIYGDEVEGLIHVHHVKPLAQIAQHYVVDPIVDLRPVCPNCHAVIHHNGKCRSLDEVTQMISKKKQ